jgi:hypothetical protein
MNINSPDEQTTGGVAVAREASRVIASEIKGGQGSDGISIEIPRNIGVRKADTDGRHSSQPVVRIHWHFLLRKAMPVSKRCQSGGFRFQCAPPKNFIYDHIHSNSRKKFSTGGMKCEAGDQWLIRKRWRIYLARSERLDARHGFLRTER